MNDQQAAAVAIIIITVTGEETGSEKPGSKDTSSFEVGLSVSSGLSDSRAQDGHPWSHSLNGPCGPVLASPLPVQLHDHNTCFYKR